MDTLRRMDLGGWLLTVMVVLAAVTSVGAAVYWRRTTRAYRSDDLG